MLDTVTHQPTPAPRRRVWDGNDDLFAITQRAMGASDEDVGAYLGRTAKAVHHRRMRLAALDALKAAAPVPVPMGHEIAIAAADVEAADLAAEAAHRRYAEVIGPYLRPVADALRLAGVCGTTGDVEDLRPDGHAWRLVEALIQCGIEIRVPA